MISLIEKFISFQKVDQNIPVGKIAKKTVWRSAFFQKIASLSKIFMKR